jgi:hypothetical protein
MLQTYRFLLSKELTEPLYEFSKIHQHDDRKSYKEAWTDWIQRTDIAQLLEEEQVKLRNTGYTGNILDKMYKSSRYYFRKKPCQSPRPKERKEYEGVSKDLLASIDSHIQWTIEETEKTKQDVIPISPEESFYDYSETHKHMILKELPKNEENQQVLKSTVETLFKRIKKTYKNRFYKCRLQLQKKGTSEEKGII